MSQSFTCPHGHHWEDVWGDQSLGPDQTALCPVCGAQSKLVTPRKSPAAPPSGDRTPPLPGTAEAPTAIGQKPVTPPAPGNTLAYQQSALELVGTERLAPPGYDIIGELGRGGMGVVYQAVHRKLKRTVALKMVLAGGHVGRTGLERFQTEAEAVARLQHPNIVQIYEVGEHEGLPFFAMEYAGGGSLTGRIKGTPQPARESAQIVATVARGLQAAHDKGIIHRDMKPSNVLLAKDGTPKITDFGLAKKLDAPDGPTKTGDVMGTPSYMAPEQAAGRLDRIGPASDVYSLGAILYEMLTARPPFKAETVMDTLLQVLQVEPVSPARLRAQTPRDLETICLKCLEKDPRRRYASATALADDLERFLQGRPIEARPVGALERAVKWARRRPAVAALVGVSGVAFVGVLVLSVVLNVVQRQWYAEEKRLNEQLDVANQGERQQAKEARAARDKAEEKQREAEQNFQLARSAVDAMLDEVGRSELVNVPLMDGVRKKLLRRALDFHRKFLAQKSSDADVRSQAGRAMIQVCKIEFLLGDAPQAEAAYHNAVALFQALVQEFPNEPKYREDQAQAEFAGAELLRRLGRLTDAENAIRQATAIQGDLTAKYPDRPDYVQHLAHSYNEQAHILLLQRQFKQSTDFYQKALALQARLAQAHGKQHPEYRADQAGTLNDLARLQRAEGKLKDAEKSYRAALAIVQELVQQHPENADFRLRRAAALKNLGVALRDLEQPAEALLRSALADWQELSTKFPSTLRYQQELAETHNNLAALFVFDEKQFPQAVAEYNKSLQVLEKLTADYPFIPEFRCQLAATLGGLGWLRAKQKQRTAALTSFDQARRLFDAVGREQPEPPQYRPLLRSHHILKAEALLTPGDKKEEPPLHAGAAQSIEEWQRLAAEAPGEYVQAAKLMARCSDTARRSQANAAALKYGAQAVDLLRAAVQRGFTDGAQLQLSKALNTLRKRPDYWELIEELQKKAQARP